MTHRRRLRVTGVVQGVGYRPFAYAEATARHLTGFVGNDSEGVFAEAQGRETDLDAFTAALEAGPPLSQVETVDWIVIDVVDGEVGFTISESGAGTGTTSIPPDTAVCADCLTELHDPTNRRYRYPFIACTHCGPRYTMVTGLPYDRPHTSMRDFPLCSACEVEYDDPADRRFHAQPTACPTCGPHLAYRGDTDRDFTGDAALAATLELLESGGIVAIKGIGGYHLAVDATNSAAVQRLRERKGRGDKPFAVMVPDIDAAERIVQLDVESTELLRSTAAPIVLAPVRDIPMRDAVAPRQDRIGVMLAYAPVHHLLFAAHPDRPGAWQPAALVMTSGNLSDEPIAIDAAEAESRLAGIADAYLHHDRRIQVSCDDSVITSTGQPVRRSRGYAPLPIALPISAPPLLSVGGELKTTISVAAGRHAWMSQHIGDTANLETLALLARTADTLSSLQRITPEVIVADLHPAYLSRRWAAERAESTGVPLHLVQHHHAHLASLLAEHGVPAGERVLGFAFDGTGYGLDDTIWGGEILLGSYAAFDRIGHLRPISLPGGDAAVRRPARTALAHLTASGLPWDDDLPPVSAADATERRVLERMLATGTSCTPTTSMGRLFDAAASLLDVRQDIDYEGQAAIELEVLAAASPYNPQATLAVLDTADGLLLDPGPLLAELIAQRRAGAPAPALAYAFHAALAEAVATAAASAWERFGVRTVGLTGGVFANRLLGRLCRERLGGLGMTVLIHRRVPPNDGGLALGQAAVAAAQIG